MRILAFTALALLSCSSTTAVSYGEQLFHDPAFAGSQFNVWSCSTCHSTQEADDSKRSGHTLAGVTTRPHYWGGNTLRLIDAASFCYVYFMRGAKPFDASETRSRALYEYLDSLKGSSEPKKVTWVPNLKELPKGDKATGKKVYAAACQTCHGETHTGKGRNSPLASVLPEIKDDYARLFPTVAPSLVFTEKVRHGQFLQVGGNMPPFALERLSDEELGALLSYLEL
jgi:thiosulfate dehydrogenase